jgi:glycosyltransferase involved in cell wall biosynthesis
MFRTLERRAAHWCDGMIFISRPLEQWADRERIGAGTPRRVIYSGIDAEAFRNANLQSVRDEFQLAPTQLVAGIVSKLWPGKGHLALLSAWSAIVKLWPDATPPVLLIVGEGELEDKLRRRVRELDIDRYVRFTGFRADIPDITAALDFAVLPSEFEGMGRVILEAMAAGKPVVASRVGGIPDIVTDGYNGLLIRPNDVEALRVALSTILTDAALRRTLSSGAAKSIRREHTAAAMVDAIHDFYAEIRRIKQPGSRSTSI